MNKNMCKSIAKERYIEQSQLANCVMQFVRPLSDGNVKESSKALFWSEHFRDKVRGRWHSIVVPENL